MSAELLGALQRAHAFDPFPVREVQPEVEATGPLVELHRGHPPRRAQT